MLDIRFIPLRNNAAVKQIMYDRIGMVIDSFAQVSVRGLVRACEMCSHPVNSFSLPEDSARSVLLNTDYSVISSFWSDNALTVGFRHGMLNQTCYPDHLVTFFADTISGNDCDTSAYSSNRTLLQTLNCYSGDEIDIVAPFINGATLSPGDSVLVYAQVEFANGEIINNCAVFEVQVIPGNQLLNSVTIDLRGKLGVITPGITYRISIYRL